MATIVITDIAWPSPTIESDLAHDAGHEIFWRIPTNTC